MRRRLTSNLALLRAAGLAALLLLLWNPVSTRARPGDAPPLVLLDASLSMAGAGGQWRAALDTARVLARGGVIWRFGTGVTTFDSAPPADGASRLRPALEAAAARGGPVIVVTDGALDDVADIPADLRRRPQIVLLPRTTFPDAFVAAVDGPRRVAAQDTIRLAVSYGTAGKRDEGRGKGTATLRVTLGQRRLASRQVTLPDSGLLSTELTLPASRFPQGASALEVRLEGVDDPEPRDDARLFVVEVDPEPGVVLLGAPPDWDTRFLARALADVARVPVQSFLETEPGRWREGASLAEVSLAQVRRAVSGAELVILAGAAQRLASFSSSSRSAVLARPTGVGLDGDWYVQPPAPSPLAPALAGIPWDSLPPLTSVLNAVASPDSAADVVLHARRARRGPPRPVVLLGDSAGHRRVTLAAEGLWRWSFRGGASAVAYRTLVAALVDWLLQGSAGAPRAARALPDRLEVANGLPLVWQWTGAGVGRGAPRDVVLMLERGDVGVEGRRVDTLRFDAAGRAALRLAPGVYRYALAGGAERGLVAVEEYSDEWRPREPRAGAQAGAGAGRWTSVALRDRWWLYAVAIAAFAAEWAWRRRRGFP